MLSDKCCLDKADQQGRGESKRNSANSSAECPHFQLHHPEVVRFREATVVESVAGAAATQVQILVHPQTEVTAAGKETNGREEREIRHLGLPPRCEVLDGINSLQLNDSETEVALFGPFISIRDEVNHLGAKP